MTQEAKRNLKMWERLALRMKQILRKEHISIRRLWVETAARRKRWGRVPRGTVQDSDIDCEAGEYYFAIDHDDENQESQSGYMYVYEGKYDPRWPLKRICSPNFVTKQYKDWWTRLSAFTLSPA